MNKDKKKITISLSLLAVLFVAIIGVSYAYYMANVVGNNDTNPSMSLKSGYLSITYTDGTEFIPTESDGTITQDKAYTKTFTVTNSGVKEGYYSVWLKDIINPFERTEDWTYTLSVGDDEIISSTVFPTSDKEILISRYIGVGESETLTLSVTYASSSEDQSADLNKTLEFNVSVVQSISEWESASEGTLLYAIKNSKKTVDGTEVSMLVSTPTSVPGREATAENEAEIASTEDDYGISYYYRGNVQNNYVTYSGMCWRIVRVQGDGTIKIVLADRAHECGTSNGYSLTDTSSAYTDNSTHTYSGNVSSITDFLFEKTSGVLVAINSWATKIVQRNGLEVTNLDTSKLVDTEWCNDTAKTSEYVGSIGIRVYSYYGAYDRLADVSNANPNLKCNTLGDGNPTTNIEEEIAIESKSTKYIGKIALLTADEIAFAGATSNSGSTGEYYLYTNANGAYWTMSPYYYNDDVDRAFVVVGELNYISYHSVTTAAYIRPSVVLQSNVTLNKDITGQNGTLDNPYVIS